MSAVAWVHIMQDSSFVYFVAIQTIHCISKSIHRIGCLAKLH